jgi:hypothetical protein
MAFGYVIPRSEYYGLPALLTTCALTVCGAYLGIADDISTGLKLFFCFLSPSVGLTMGVLAIESYLFFNDGSMDYDFVNEGKQYPSLSGIIGVTCASAVTYYFIAVGMPFDWIFPKENTAEVYAASRVDEIKYPCDNEEEESKTSDVDPAKCILNVATLSHIYPDGTHAVKDISFKVKEGEVLSFLGSNGAGELEYLFLR